MPRKQKTFPTPSLRYKSGSWCIRWCWERKSHEFSTGYSREHKESAETALASFALALRTEDWPEWTDDIPVIQRWRATKEQTATNKVTSEKAIKEWIAHYSASSKDRQIAERVGHLKFLAERHDLLSLTPAQAAEAFGALAKTAPPKYFSDQIADIMGNRVLSKQETFDALIDAGIEVDTHKVCIALRNRDVFELIPHKGKKRTGKYRVCKTERGLAPRSRNKYLISFNMFYRWAVDRGLIKRNPFDGIRSVRVDDHAEIVWLTRDERDQVTRTAEGSPARAAIWIALYAGLRLGEIARLRWEDVDLNGRWIHVKKSKTGRSRRVPISEALLSALAGTPKKSEVIAPHWQQGDFHVKADSDLRAIGKSLPMLADKLRWNIFRHTFASLLAQTGKVSIDQISALMGNTPEVCRRHYAHLVPDQVERTGIDLID